MNTQLLSLSKIFTEKLLRIPDYQRGYAWTEKQLKDYWSDIMQLDGDKNHYTGVLTLEDVPSDVVQNWSDDYWIIRSKGYTPYYIVDGQQRLTTSIVLIQVITEFVPDGQKINYTTKEEIRKKFIYDSKDEGISRSYIFGYEKDNPSYEFLKTVVFLEKSDNSFPLQETIYTHNLERAKEFFREKLKEMPLNEVEVIYRKLTQNMLFNIYSISNEVDVFVAFETMNNRGKPLSHLELLKNRLIYLSTKFTADDFEKQKLRHSINEAWKSVYHYLGKNKLKPLDDDIFLFNHFILYFGEELKKQEIKGNMPGFHMIQRRQNTFKDYLLEKKFTSKNINNDDLEDAGDRLAIRDIYTYVHSLKSSVEVWYHLLNPQDSPFSDEEKFWLEKLNRLGIFSIAPMIMVYYQKDRNSKNRVRLLKALERYLFFMLFLTRPVYYPNAERFEFSEVAIQLIKDSLHPDKLIKDVEQHVDEIVSRADIISQLKTDFRGINFYGWRGTKHILYEYELDIKGRSRTYREKIDPEVFFDSEDSKDFHTIEHIYPQRPRKPCWIDVFQKYTDRERSILRNCLGNLVPLSQPKNSSFQNNCFEDKKGNATNPVGFKYGSYSENEVANNDEWTAKEILLRGLKIIEFVEKRWKMKFGDTQDKIKMLNLEFVVNKEKIKID